MARALVRLGRTGTGLPWEASSAYLATVDRLEGRAFPGREAWVIQVDDTLRQGASVLASGEGDAPKDYETWVDWALDYYANGYFTWAIEVAPADTIDHLLARLLEADANPRNDKPSSPASDPVIDPVGTIDGIELVEVSHGMLFQLERETATRVYGVVLDGDGEYPGAYPVQSSFRKDRVIRRTPLSRSHPGGLPRADGKEPRYTAEAGWDFSDTPQIVGPPDDEVLGRYPLPNVEWPQPIGGFRDLRVFRDRVEGALLGCAIGDALGGQVDGLSRGEVLAALGPLGVAQLPPDGATTSDATELVETLARSLISKGGQYDLADHLDRLIETPWVGRGSGGSLAGFAAAVNAGQSWFNVARATQAADYGAAVRVAPVGLVHAADPTPLPLLREAVRSALITHRHSTAVGGAVAMAAAVGYLVRLSSTGESNLEPRAFLDFVATSISQIEAMPTATRRPPVREIYLRDRIRRIEGWLSRDPTEVVQRVWSGPPALESVPIALFAFLRSPDRVETSLKTAANATHETAAIGAMTGTLLGAWLGADRFRRDIPQWVDLTPRRTDLVELANGLVDTALDTADRERPPTLFG